MTSKPSPQRSQLVIDRLNEEIGNSSIDGLFEIVAPVETSVLMKDRRYKTIPFKGSEELILKGVRAGKRSEFIFEFGPVDDQPYTQIEFAEKKVFNAVGGFEGAMVKALGFEGTEILSFSDAVAAYVDQAEKAEEASKVAIERAADSVYETNPNYGIF